MSILRVFKIKSVNKWELVVKNALILQAQRNKNMNSLIGQCECKLDGKGRLMFPATFKEQMGASFDEGFVLRPGLHANCVELFTMSDWRQTQERFQRLDVFKKKNVDVIRIYIAGARLVKPDSNGRLLIPKELIKKGGFVKDVTIISLTANLEIWDSNAFNEEVNKISAEEFGNLIEEQFSNLNE